jgi:mannose/fructose/N-acetylgalactosamine-specific phosphotransferase system component IIC
MFVQALLVALVFYIVGVVSTPLGLFHFNRPIIVGPLVGLVLGDLQTGIILGATFEAVFLGVIAIGGAMPADPTTGTALGTAMAILTNATPEAALAIAVHLSVLAMTIGFLPVTTFNPILVGIAQKAAAEGDEKKVIRIAIITSLLLPAFNGLAIFLAVYFGVDAINRMLEVLPMVIIKGLGAAGSILPAVGFALLLNMIFSKKVVVFFFLGAVLSLYLGLPSIAIAVIAVVISIYTFVMMPQNEGGTAAKAKADSDEEFFK